MAKNKKHKLVRTQIYSPIIAIMGSKHHMDYMPVDISTRIENKNIKINTKGSMSRKRMTFSKHK